MAAPALVFFPHRHNKDGSFDSICTKCFATIASAQIDAELAVYDRKHVCDPLVLWARQTFVVISRLNCGGIEPNRDKFAYFSQKPHVRPDTPPHPRKPRSASLYKQNLHVID